MDLSGLVNKIFYMVEKKQSQAFSQLQRQFQTVKINQIQQDKYNSVLKQQNLQAQQQMGNNPQQKQNLQKDQYKKDYSNRGFFGAIFSRIQDKNGAAIKQFLLKIQSIEITNHENQNNNQLSIDQESIKINKNETRSKPLFSNSRIQQQENKTKTTKGQNINDITKERHLSPEIQNTKNNNQQTTPKKYEQNQQTSKNIQTPDQTRKSVSRRRIRLPKNYRPQSKQARQSSKKQRQQNQKTAKQIMIQLQQIHRQKSIQRQRIKSIQHSKSLQKSQQMYKNHRTFNTRQKIMKLNPQATLEYKQKKQKQLQTKMKDNIQFLQRIKKPTIKNQQLLSKQFIKNNEEVIKLKQSLRIRTVKRDDLKNYHNIHGISRRQDILTMTDPKKANKLVVMLSQNRQQSFQNPRSSNIFSKQSLNKKDLPPVVVNRHGMRPKPYSVYNVFQKNDQIFTNFLGARQ